MRIDSIDLKESLPEYYENITEMQELMGVENTAFNEAEKNMIRLFNDLSPVTAGEEALTIFERFFELVILPGDTIERRRMRVLSAIIFRPPYTVAYLTERIGALGTTVKINEFFNEYRIEIITSFNQKGEVDELPFLFARVIPSNLVVDSLNNLAIETVGRFFVGTLNAYTIINQTTSDYEAEYAPEGVINTGQVSQVWKELVTE